MDSGTRRKSMHEINVNYASFGILLGEQVIHLKLFVVVCACDWLM